MNTFCTIITSNYFPYALALYKSLTKFSPTEKLQVLVCDDGSIDQNLTAHSGITITRLNKLYGYSITDSIFHKYGSRPDALRWSMKPIFINYLLEKGFEKVIFTDCDICFFNNYDFLYTELDTASILLTLQHTTKDPAINEEEFLTLFNFGIFNAGFVAASKKGIPALKWWANVCNYKIEMNHTIGLHNDQRYLDALPVFFDDVKTISHKGCNIALWNQHECERSIVNGQLLINKKYPVIFIHFTRNYIPELLEGNDPLILPYLRVYEKCFQETGHTFNNFIPHLPEYNEPNLLIKVKQKLLIRTRIKRWLFKLSQK
jgi:hypothetical protein